MSIFLTSQNPEIVNLLLKNGANPILSFGRHKKFHKISNRITINLPKNFENIKPIDVAIENRKIAIINKNREQQRKNEKIIKLLLDYRGFSTQYPDGNKLIDPIDEENTFINLNLDTPRHRQLNNTN